MKKNTRILIFAIAIIFIGSVYFIFSDSSHTSSVLNQESSAPAAEISTSEVAKHAARTSCYTIVGDAVYDLTEWIKQHPGGASAILGICGKDGTIAFRGQHGSDSQAQEALATFRIGVLAE